MKKYLEHISKWENNRNRFEFYFRQSVCDFYRHADNAEVYEKKMAACKYVAMEKYGYTAEEFEAKRMEHVNEFEPFYADEKTVAELMACNH